MRLHGTVAENLRAAIGSAERLRTRPVYRETIAHWAALVAEARRVRPQVMPKDMATLDVLIARLAAELAAR